MKRYLILAAFILAGSGLFRAHATAGTISGITYTDLPIATTTDLTTAGTLDWVKWGNGGVTGSTVYTTPEMVGGTIIDPALSPLGTVPPGQTVLLVGFNPPPVTLDFTWTNGTEAMDNGGPVGTVISETIDPAQFSYPLGLGARFQAEAAAAPRILNIFVQGFNTRMQLSASLSGGGSSSLIASNAALNLMPTLNNNYISVGYFSVEYWGAGETLTINLTAANQNGVPNAPQFGFRNAGVFAATVVEGSAIPEPSSLVSSGIAGLLGLAFTLRRHRKANAS